MGVEIPAAESLEAPKAENEVNWKKAADKTGFIYSGKNSFKSGEGEFTTVGQGDSFTGSHAYLLLADVPGANANSGATITSEDSNGKAAFMATETRGTTEQEVAVGAGSELKTVLDATGTSDFLQLIATGKRKINFGEATAHWPGGSEETEAATVNHGLGATPKVVIPGAKGEATIFVSGTPNGTSFQIKYKTPGFKPGAGNISFYWLAIG